MQAEPNTVSACICQKKNDNQPHHCKEKVAMLDFKKSGLVIGTLLSLVIALPVQSATRDHSSGGKEISLEESVSIISTSSSSGITNSENSASRWNLETPVDRSRIRAKPIKVFEPARRAGASDLEIRPIDQAQ